MVANDVKQSQGQPRLLVSRQALMHNLRLIRQQLAPGTKVCAMVKADAYGHDTDIVVDTLVNYEADGLPTPAVEQLGVASLDEAGTILESSLPILVLRPIENVYIGKNREAVEQAIGRGWIVTIGTPAAADDVARIAVALQKRANVHVQIDTGMTRCGCSIVSLRDLLSRIESHNSLKLVSLGTHFATADVSGSWFVAEQFGRFRDATDEFAAMRAGRVIRHTANSAATFFAPQTHLDMVRPGIALYGIDPTCKPSMDRALRPIAKWTAPLVSILNAPKGATVGYGQTWTAPRDTRIGLLPIGYADGYLRAWSNRATMIVQGKPVPVVGRISMDLTTIDLHDVPGANIGDEVTVLDDDPLSPASAYGLAELGNSFVYEIFTRIGLRVRRVAVE
jgi:alanine racemase